MSSPAPPTLQLGREVASQEHCSLKPADLVTHGVILGMTGSGKTGLALTLLEELVEAGVPLMLLDPKGDLANLGLLFPELSDEQLEGWVEPEQRAAVRERLQRGRLQWGIGPSRVAALRDRLELRIYTPGSRAGRSLNLLGNFRRPGDSLLQDSEARIELISGQIQGLLALVGVEADPLRAPEAVVLSQILDQAWEQGQDLSLEDLVLKLVDPPFKKVGVFPLESFFPSAQRMELAMKLNALVASPAFSSWSQGEPLDPELWQKPTTPGKVPVNLFYLAHLSDSERMFFVSLMLHRLRSWSRGLAGTTQLRTLLYFDEVAGYMPPHPLNPASKQPLLTLLKQARAVGLGVVLATQNPVDLDYKGLANTGTWWVGKMQTSQDRARVSQGLTLAEAGLDNESLTREFEQLESRVFLLKSPSHAVPRRVETRFAMSLLRGPVTRTELPRLQPAPPAASDSSPAAAAAPAAATRADNGLVSHPPPAPTGFAQAFLDPRTVFSARLEGAFEAHALARREDGKTLWRPALWGEVQLRFADKAFVLDELHHYLFFPLGERLPEQWTRLTLEADDLLGEPAESGLFEQLPAAFDEARELKGAQAAMQDDLYRRVTSSQWLQAELKLYGAGGESQDDFRRRVEAAVQERIDQKVAKLQARYDKEIATLQERLARHESRLDTLRNESQRRQTESLYNAGAALLGFFTGKKRALSSALSSHHRSSSAKDRVGQAEGELEQLQLKMAELASKLESEVADIEAQERAALERIEQRNVRLQRSDIRLVRFGVLWIPVTRRL